jgi:hypothetical protein
MDNVSSLDWKRVFTIGLKVLLHLAAEPIMIVVLLLIAGGVIWVFGARDSFYERCVWCRKHPQAYKALKNDADRAIFEKMINR